MELPLKNYQLETVAKLGEYCDAVRRASLTRVRRPEREAFEAVTGRADYFAPPGFDGIPYVCLRLPTGGGKTLLAAHAVGTVARRLLGSDAPACLWICPNTTIRDQTLRVLRDKPLDHHYLALRDALGPDVSVATLEEALQQPNLVAGRSPLVIVTNIQAYRVKDERSGEEVVSNRRIYRDSGYLQRAFEDIPAALRPHLAQDSRGLIDLSLANALMLRGPIVVMDEAHNARTPTSFESLARFGPSCVIELTATPEQEHDPANERYASNVLHPVSALQLKNEGMIKLPIDLEGRRDWLEVLAATKNRLDELQKKADEFEEEGGRPIRPIALLQAQQKRANQETHHAEAVKAALIERLQIPADEIRICTGTIDEIGEEDLMRPACPVRYIITVDKLREGWDCPFAYVLGSIGNAATPTAVEQLLGRVMRQPYATPTHVPALDRAYAFVLSENVTRTAMDLRDRLVESCGFDARAAADALRVRSVARQSELAFGRIPLSAPPTADALPDSLRSRVRFDPTTGTLQISGNVTQRDALALQQAVQTPADQEVIDDFWQQMRPAGTTPRPLQQHAPSLFVPQLALRIGGQRTLFEPEELDYFTWDLDHCEAALSPGDFPDDLSVGSAATIDLEGERLVSASVGEVRLRQLELIGEGDDWTEVELVRWLDRELHRDDAFLGLPKAESQPWMHRVLQDLLQRRTLSLPVVVRRRHELSQLLRVRIADHGRSQARLAAQRLIQEQPDAVETSPRLTFEMSNAAYGPYNTFDRHQFGKHAFDIVASMRTEEAQCAGRIDLHPNVKRWVRNPDNETQGGFCLPKSPGKFFPDFIVELLDGTIVIIEYKMGKMSYDPEERHKRAVGELWAARSSDACRFGYVIDRDWSEVDRVLRA